MSLKEDLLRIYAYGRDEYYQAIQEIPSYQTELERVRLNYNARTWIDFSGFLPKFTTEEFNIRREKYQAKYGNEINIPGFADVIHIIPKASISAEERAAHLWATKRGLPSPLTQAQLESLKYKKFRFLKALASPTPDWMKTYGSVATMLDNIEDALVSIAVIGRIAVKFAPRLTGRLIPGIGWVLLGSDMLNAVNIISYVSFASMTKKRIVEGLAEKNPFHAKAAARRALKLKRTIPTFGETIEVLQTTDQLFGVGLCLGGLMGLVTDTASLALDPEYWKGLGRVLTSGNINEISYWISRAAVNDFNAVKRNIQLTWTSLKDEAYRLKTFDQNIREGILGWAEQKAKETWGWVKTIPDQVTKTWSDPLIAAMILSTGMDDYLPEDHTKAFMSLDLNLKPLMSWWIENDPLTNFKELRDWKFRAPAPTNEITFDHLDTYIPNWQTSIGWPHLGTLDATIEEIAYTYAPMIKTSLQTYCLRYQHQYDAMIAAQQCVEFTKDIIRSFSDDNDVKLGMSAWWAISEDMCRDVWIMPPDTTGTQIDELADYISDFERQHNEPPSMREVAGQGDAIGIEWMRTFPRRGFEAAAEIFPEWQTIEDQIADIFVMD